MRNKLLDIGLPENLVDEILTLFERYDKHPHFYPPERFMPMAELKNNVISILNLSSRLATVLRSLSPDEMKFFMAYGSPDLQSAIDMIKQLQRSSDAVRKAYGISDKELKKLNENAIKKKPKTRKKKACYGEDRVQAGHLSLAFDLKKLFEAHGIPVRSTRDKRFCPVLNILLNICPDIPEDRKDGIIIDTKDSDVSSHLLRQISKPGFTPNFF